MDHHGKFRNIGQCSPQMPGLELIELIGIEFIAVRLAKALSHFWKSES